MILQKVVVIFFRNQFISLKHDKTGTFKYSLVFVNDQNRLKYNYYHKTGLNLFQYMWKNPSSYAPPLCKPFQ